MAYRSPKTQWERDRKNKRSRERYMENIERERLRGKIYREANREKCIERAIRNRTPERSRRVHLKRKYGIDQRIYELILKDQNGCCAICFSDLSENKAHIDHCHSKNIVRGILCNKCNFAIGLLREDPKIIISAHNYVYKSADATLKHRP